MVNKEAMKLALEALAVKFSEGWHEGIKIDASDIMLLNDAAQALAEQPAQQSAERGEPVASLHAVYFRNNWDGEGDIEYVLAHLSEKGEWTRHENGAPLIEFKGDEIIKTWPLTFEIATPQAQPAQQKPVAWRYTDARGHYRYRGFVANFDKKYPMLKPQPLYTPPSVQRTWVGLTDEEVHALWMTGEANIAEEHHSVVAYEIEAKLREKNT